MNLISLEERITLLKNLLEDPEDDVSRELLRLAYRYDSEPSDGNSFVITPIKK
jgi:hypothetical protein